MSAKTPESKLSESSKQLLYPETVPAPAPDRKQQRFKLLLPALGLLALMLVGGGLGLWVRNRQDSEPVPEQLPPPPESPAPSPKESPSPGAESPQSSESPAAETPSPDAETPPPEVATPTP